MSHPVAPFVAKVYRALRQEAGLVADAELLRRFASNRDEASFELLLWRHGPMVWGVCKRVLGHTHDAEDAFQASFLALARKARTIGEGKSLPGWLYRVALRAALAALKARQLRRGRVENGICLEDIASPDDLFESTARREMGKLIDGEIAQLPEKFRVPFILCQLQGRRRAEVAAELRCPIGTVESRVNRARAKLRSRLAKRGLALTGGLATVTFPNALRAATVRLVVSSGSAASASVALLTDNALRGLTSCSLKLSLASVFSTCLVLAGIGQAALRAPVNDDKDQDAPQVSEPKSEAPHANVDAEPLPKEALARVGSTRFRHADGILSTTYSPDGKCLATASTDGTARVWDANTGKLNLKVALAEKDFALVGFARQGKSLLLVDSQTVRIIDLATGKEQTNNPFGRPKPGRKGHRNLGGAIAADGSKFLIRENTEIIVIDSESGRELHSFSPTGIFVQNVEFTPDGNSAVVSPGNEKAFVIDVATGKVLHEISDDQRRIPAATMSPNGTTLATLSTGKGRDKDRVLLWNLKTGKSIQQMDNVEITGSCLAFSPDGKSLVTGNIQRLHLQLFDVATGKEIKSFRCMPSVQQVVFSPDGKTLVARRYFGDLSLFDVKSGKKHPASPDGDGGIGRLQFTNGGKNLLVGSADIAERDWKSGQIVRRYPEVTQELFGVPILSPDRTMMAAFDTDGAIRLVDAKTGEDIKKLKGHSNFVHRAAFSPDGAKLYSLGYDHSIRFWDIKTGQELAKAAVPNVSSLDDLAASPDGLTLVTLSRETPTTENYSLRLWDVKSATEVRRTELPKFQAAAIAFSPDSTHVACFGGLNWQDCDKPSTILLWNTAAGRLMPLEGPLGYVFTAAFSPDGRTLATGGRDHMVRLREVASGKERHIFKGHEGAVAELTFSADGNLLASCSFDAPIFIWDMAALYGTERRKGTFTDKGRKDSWEKLASADADEAFETIKQLLAIPNEAVTILRDGLKAEPKLDAKRIEQLISDLDSNSFDEREKATVELTKVVDAIEPHLRKTLEQAPSPEVKARLERILESLDKPKPHSVRGQRALEVLERIGTPEARKVLEEIATVMSPMQIGIDAAKTLERLSRQPRRN